MERAARFSVIATEQQQNGNVSGETPTSSVPSNSSANLDRVRTEPVETTDSAMENHSPCPSQNNRSGKRKEFEKKVKSSTTEKNKSSEENEKLPYVHVRARRGQATDSHSLAERARREKINARMKLLQELVPGCLYVLRNFAYYEAVEHKQAFVKLIACEREALLQKKGRRKNDRTVKRRKSKNENGIDHLVKKATQMKRRGEKEKRASPSWKVVIEKPRMMKILTNSWRVCFQVRVIVRVSKAEDHLLTLRHKDTLYHNLD